MEYIHNTNNEKKLESKFTFNSLMFVCRTKYTSLTKPDKPFQWNFVKLY
jgi:hypothetical protein